MFKISINRIFWGGSGACFLYSFVWTLLVVVGGVVDLLAPKP